MSAEKRRYNEDLARIRTAFLENGSASCVLAERTELVDKIVRDAFAAELAAQFPGGLALLAVGGYGRRELFPHSDVDLLLLVVRADQPPEARNAFSAFFRVLWDAGLRISHSTRTPNECCEIHDRNIELNVSLLDERLLAGDESLYNMLSDRLPEFLAGQRATLDKHLCRLARARHAKFQHSIYHMEPDIKEAPGGMRDLHLLGWFEGSPENQELMSARRFLSQLRCLLHFGANRDANLFTFDLQESAVTHPFIGQESPEEYMRQYFRYARAVNNAALRRMDSVEASGSKLLAQFRDWRSRLSNVDFSVHRERVFLRNPHQAASDPALAMRLFEFVARHGLRPSSDTERRLLEAAPFYQQHFAQPRRVWSDLKSLLELPHAAVTLRAMEDTGFLRALFPEWRTVECLVVRDFYHRYTVDEHTLVAIQSIADLRDSKDPSRQRFRDLLAETPHVALLLLALLFHDVGKGARTGSHAVESLRLAGEAMNRISVPQEEQQIVKTLVERHLELSAIMTSRDLDDPVTAAAVTERTGTLELLKLLTLLTYADISGVNPAAMTPWRLEQLWRVYRVGSRELTRALEDERIPDAPENDFLAGFPTRYLRTRSRKEVDKHLELAGRARAVGVAVELERADGVWTATVITRDRPFLFASIAGVLAASGMNILRAEAFSNRNGEALDTFAFADPIRTLELNPPEVVEFHAMLENAALGELDVKRLLKKRPTPRRPSNGSQVRPSISVHQDFSESATLIEVFAEDRPGLLYDLASAISDCGCNIEVVLIDTEVHRALDVFYVTSEGRKVLGDAQEDLQKRLLAACGAVDI